MSEKEPAMSDVPVDDVEFRRLQEAEYGTYVAAVPINIRGARAFNAGDPVPVSHVERGVVSADDVERVTDPAKPPVPKAGKAITTEPEEG